jgi:hypothetical protein
MSTDGSYPRVAFPVEIYQRRVHAIVLNAVQSTNLQHLWSRSHPPRESKHRRDGDHPKICYLVRDPDARLVRDLRHLATQSARSVALHGSLHNWAGIDLKHCVSGMGIQSEGIRWLAEGQWL